MSNIVARTRFLARLKYKGVSEYTAVEVSPCGQQVKLKPVSGDMFWAKKADIHLVEILPTRNSNEDMLHG